MRLVHALVVASWLLCIGFAPALEAQDHTSHSSSAHRHPPGVRIIMDGTLLEPVCAFARRSIPDDRAAPPAVVPEARANGPEGKQPPVLLGFDRSLYLLHPANPSAIDLVPLVNQRVVVRGTVFPAGSGYIIIVDSVEPNEASGSPRAATCPP